MPTMPRISFPRSAPLRSAGCSLAHGSNRRTARVLVGGAALLALSLAGCGGGTASNTLQLAMFAPITAEATSAAGATVAVPAPTVSDASATVTCTPNVGTATYGLGTTAINCSATNAAGDVATGTSFVRVLDTTPPSLAMFAPITVAATSASGAVTSVPAPTAGDATGTPTVSCTPSPGLGTYPVGTTTVVCTATDASGNKTTANSTVTVLPFVPGPGLQLTMFAAITAEATSAAGATVTVPAPSVNDNSASVTCTPNFGTATYPLGTTTVSCSATNAAGDVATGASFVRILDTTPPSLAMFAPITAAATSASGAAVNVPSPSASDATGTPTVSCTPATGSGTYPVGTTTVVCTATDASGNKTTANSTVTVTAAGPTSAFRAISAGLEVTCALTTDGTPYCWGNAQTLLGLSPAPTATQLTPQPVQTALKFTSISVSGYINQGDQTACALTADGSAYCWGNNGSGAIGDGTTTNRVSPTPVSDAHHFVSISTRVGTTCAIDTVGAGWCWGGNVAGALGNGDINGFTKLTPVQLQTSAHLVQLSMGFEGGCALTDTQQVLCWGNNNLGQLGRGSLVPYFGINPQPVIGLGAMASVQAGDSQVCALSTTGAAFCWGSTNYGALGNGATGGNAVTTPVTVLGGRIFAGLTAGFQATCGWTLGLPGADGSSACWGSNSFGELGDGSRTDQSTPTPVASALSFSVIALSVADGSTHACALTAQGQAYCWGVNSSGQLGDGSTNPHLAPGPVTMP